MKNNLVMYNLFFIIRVSFRYLLVKLVLVRLSSQNMDVHKFDFQKKSKNQNQ